MVDCVMKAINKNVPFYRLRLNVLINHSFKTIGCVPILLIILLSTSSGPKIPKIAYSSSANDMAKVELKLYENGKYLLDIRPLGEGEILKYKGRYTQSDSNFELHFKKNKNVNLIFQSDPQICKDPVNINNQSITLPKANKTICIWGIVCIKTK